MKNDEIQNNDTTNEINEPTPIKNDVGDSNNLQPVKNNNWIISILLIIIILMAAGLVYVLFFTKPNDEVKDNNTQETEKENEKEEESSKVEEEPQEEQEVEKKYELTVYRDKYDKELTDDNKASSDTEVAFKIATVNKDAKVLDVYGTKYVLYKDDALYLYDVKNKKSEKLSLEDSYVKYKLLLDINRTKLVGISYLKSNDTMGYYNYDKKIKLYDGKYKLTISEGIDKEVEFIGAFEIVGKYLSHAPFHSTNIYLLNNEKEKVEISYKSNNDSSYAFGAYEYNGKYFYSIFDRFGDGGEVKIYSNSLKLITDKEISDVNMYSYDKNYIYLKDGKSIKKYDIEGKLISTYGPYDNIQDIDSTFVLYVENSALYLKYYDKSEAIRICDWNDDYNFEFASYYDRKALNDLDEPNKPEGLYIVFYYGYDEHGDAIRDGKGNYGIEFCYTNDKQVVEFPIKHEMGGRAKPVLYLYPTKETNVTVKFEKPNLLTTTYPKYINSWNVKVSPNGDMYDKDGKYYYALYWDEKRYNEVDFKEGFYVEGKDAIKFLEEKLAIIGLNDKERNEFIMYWLPIMEANKKNLVYFELTKERELGNKLIITPKPDSLLRVSIHIKKVNEKVNIKEQKLESFKRVGFTAVEWGGMTY